MSDKFKRVLELAKSCCLLEVNFLDDKGEVAKERKHYTQVQFGFDNGEEITLPASEAVLLKDVQFKLAESHKMEH